MRPNKVKAVAVRRLSIRSLALCLVEPSQLGPPVLAFRKAHCLCDLSTLAGVKVFCFVVPQTKNF